MTSNRPYREAMPHRDAVAELGSHAGTQFDPDVVQALVGYLYGRRQAGAAV
jgi:HD-GYP domain-containing protein (c-di-GMP phosphodiesterase class II)